MPCSVEQVSYGDGSPQALLYIQVTGWFIEHVDVSSLDAHHGTGKSLQLSTTEIFNISVPDRLQV